MLSVFRSCQQMFWTCLCDRLKPWDNLINIGTSGHPEPECVTSPELPDIKCGCEDNDDSTDCYETPLPAFMGYTTPAPAYVIPGITYKCFTDGTGNNRFVIVYLTAFRHLVLTSTNFSLCLKSFLELHVATRYSTAVVWNESTISNYQWTKNKK